ncbi:MAG: hypothetical protein O3A51_14555, partial [Verrucomicrobia bacterium]|nr:hypothetical protein [Verrucomicrobiota bacterium]
HEPFQLTLDLPRGTTAIIRLPQGGRCLTTLTVNGKIAEAEVVNDCLCTSIHQAGRYVVIGT